MVPSVQNAIARIEVRRDGKVVSRGAASLVDDNLVLTSLHVVAERDTDPLRFRSGEIWVTFPNQLPIRATVLQGKWDAREDWVLLTCTSQPPQTVRPLRLAMVERDGDSWETHGFPDAKAAGITVGGTVRNHHGNLQGEHAYQLFCDEAGSGKGLRVRGLSGSPVIVGDALIGVVRWSPLEDERNEGGTLYACPATVIAARCPDYFPDPLNNVLSSVRAAVPSPTVADRHRWWLVTAGFTLVAALVVAYVILRPQAARSNQEVTAPQTQNASENTPPKPDLSPTSASFGFETVQTQKAPSPAIAPGPPNGGRPAEALPTARPSTVQTPSVGPQACPPDAAMVGPKLDLPRGGKDLDSATLIVPCTYKGQADVDDDRWTFYKLRVQGGQTLKAVIRLRDTELPPRGGFDNRPRLRLRLHDRAGASVSEIGVDGASEGKEGSYKVKESDFAYVSLTYGVKDSVFQFSIP